MHTSFHVKIKNVGNYPAYNLIAYLDPGTHAALPNLELTKSIISVLGKDQEETICVLNEENVKRIQSLQEAFIVNVDYESVLGEGGGVSFIFQPQNISSPITVHGLTRLVFTSKSSRISFMLNVNSNSNKIYQMIYLIHHVNYLTLCITKVGLSISL
jgi:hypothetical protein